VLPIPGTFVFFVILAAAKDGEEGRLQIIARHKNPTE